MSEAKTDNNILPGQEDCTKSARVIESVKMLSKRERASKRLITVEPALIFFSFGFGLIANVRTMYIRNEIALSYNVTSSDNFNSTCTANDTSSETDKDIQAETASTMLRFTAVSNFTSMFALFFLGVLSDHVGRKRPMIISLTGCLIWGLLYAMTALFRLPMWTFYIAELAYGVSGGMGGFVNGCRAYLADTNEGQSRAVRFGIMGMITILCIGVMQIVAGFLILITGYYLPLIVAACFMLAALMYVTLPFLLLETVETNIKLEKNVVRIFFQDAYDLLKINENGRRWHLLGLIAISIIMGLGSSEFLPLVLLNAMGEPICWSPIDIGIFVCINLVIHGVFTAVGMRLLPRVVSDFWTAQIAITSSTLQILITGLAQTTTPFYIGLAVGIFSMMKDPMFQLMMSKQVSTAEQGVLFGTSSLIHSVFTFIIPLIMNELYSSTVHKNPSIVFLVMVAISSVGSVLLGMLQFYVYRRKKRSEPDDQTGLINPADEDFSAVQS